MYRVNSTVRFLNLSTVQTCTSSIRLCVPLTVNGSEILYTGSIQLFVPLTAKGSDMFHVNLTVRSFNSVFQTSAGSIQMFVPLTVNGYIMHMINSTVRPFNSKFPLLSNGSDKYRVKSTVCSHNCRWFRYVPGQFESSFLYFPKVQTSTGSIPLFVPITPDGSDMYRVNLNVRSFTCQWFRQVHGQFKCLFLYLPMVQLCTWSIQLFVPLTVNDSDMYRVNSTVRSLTCK